jgi:hypothetical protein
MLLFNKNGGKSIPLRSLNSDPALDRVRDIVPARVNVGTTSTEAAAESL